MRGQYAVSYPAQMPLFVGLAIAFVYLVLSSIGTSISQLLGEGRRRLARSYRSGYALVPEGAGPGDVIEQEAFVVSRDPIVLPAWIGADDVARVAAVRGVRAQRRMYGWWWTATSAQVVEVLPYWVVLGPSGRLATMLIGSTPEMAAGRLAEARLTIDEPTIALITHGDPWRENLYHQLAAATRTFVKQAVAQDLLPPDGPEPSDEEVAAAQIEYERQLEGWTTAIDVTRNAALAAALIDELDPEDVDRLTRDWARLVGFDSTPWQPREAGVNGRIRRWVRSVRRFVDRHPTVALLLTITAFLPGLGFAPEATVILYLVLLGVVSAIVVLRALRRGRRIRRRRWMPRGDVENAIPDPNLLRRLMTTASDGASWLAARRLDILLEHAEVWVAMDGPAPDDPSRTLRWISQSGQRAPVHVSIVDGRRYVLAFTDADRHRGVAIDNRVGWTARCRYTELTAYMERSGVDALVLDPGREPSLEIAMIKPDSAKAPDEPLITNAG